LLPLVAIPLMRTPRTLSPVDHSTPAMPLPSTQIEAQLWAPLEQVEVALARSRSMEDPSTVQEFPVAQQRPEPQVLPVAQQLQPQV